MTWRASRLRMRAVCQFQWRWSTPEIIFLARAGEESGDLDFRRHLLFVSRSGNGGGRMDRLLCFAPRIARRFDRVHDAGIFLDGADGGPGLGHRFSASVFKCTSLRRGRFHPRSA